MAHDVFISYASENRAIANAVCALLERRGLRCWIAPRDILPGMNYAEALIEAIGAARVLVLVFSSHANQSPQVMREVERAVSRGMPIVPFRIEDVPPSKAMEYYISAPHWLDAITPPVERHIERLADTVRVLLDPTRVPAPPPPVPAPRPRRVPLIAGVLSLAVIGLATYWFGFRPKTLNEVTNDSKLPGPRAASTQAAAPMSEQIDRQTTRQTETSEPPRVAQIDTHKPGESGVSSEETRPTEHTKMTPAPTAVEPKTDARTSSVDSADTPAARDSKSAESQKNDRTTERPKTATPIEKPNVPPVEVPPAEGAAFFDVGFAVGQMQQAHSSDLSELLLAIDHRTGAQLDGRLFNTTISNDPATIRGTVQGAVLEFETREGRYQITADGSQAAGTCTQREAALQLTLARSAASNELLEAGTVWSGTREVWQSSEPDKITLTIDWRADEAIKGRLFAPAHGITPQELKGIVLGGTLLLQGPDHTRYVTQLGERQIAGRWVRPNKQFGGFLAAYNAGKADAIQAASVWVGARQAVKDQGDLLIVFGTRAGEDVTGRLFMPLDEGNRGLDFNGHVVADRLLLETSNHTELDGVVSDTVVQDGAWRRGNDPVGVFNIALRAEQAVWLTTGMSLKGQIEVPRKADLAEMTMQIEKREGAKISGKISNGQRNGSASEFQGEILGNCVLLTTRTHDVYYGVAENNQISGRWKPPNQKEPLSFVLNAE